MEQGGSVGSRQVGGEVEMHVCVGRKKGKCAGSYECMYALVSCVYMYLSLYHPFCHFHVNLFVSVFLTIYLFVCLFFYLFICLSINLSNQSVYLSVYLSIFFYLSLCPSTYLCTRVVQFKMTLGLPFENEATHRKMFIPNTTLKFT